MPRAGDVAGKPRWANRNWRGSCCLCCVLCLFCFVCVLFVWFLVARLLFVCLVGWSVGRSGVRLVGWLLRWLVGCLATRVSIMYWVVNVGVVFCCTVNVVDLCHLPMFCNRQQHAFEKRRRGPQEVQCVSHRYGPCGYLQLRDV